MVKSALKKYQIILPKTSLLVSHLMPVHATKNESVQQTNDSKLLNGHLLKVSHLIVLFRPISQFQSSQCVGTTSRTLDYGPRVWSKK